MSDKPPHNAIPGGGGFHKSSAYLTKSDDGYKRHGQHIDVTLHGEGLLGESLAPKRQGNMAEKFIVPPFSVLSARDGWWQNRKRMWLALGIKSELGRGGELTWQGEVAKEGTRTITQDRAAPGGSLMPAMDYSKKERDNGAGKPVVLALQAPERPGGAAVAGRALQAAGAPAARPISQDPVVLTTPAAPRYDVTSAPRLYPPSIVQSPAPIYTDPGTRINYEDPFLAAHAAELDAAADRPIIFDEASWDRTVRSAVGVDVEVFVNFFVACFKRFSDGRRIAFEKSARCELDRDGLRAAMESGVIISYNGTTYDLPIIYLALRGASNSELKAASDKIIFGNMRPWEAGRAIGVSVPKLNHIDMIESNPAVRQSLKTLHGRLHGRFMVDLPYDPAAVLTPRGMNVTTLYCHNDLDATEVVYRALREPFELRVALGREHGADFRSRSDSQIGEAIVKMRVERSLGRRIERSTDLMTTFGYDPPDFLRFSRPDLIRMLEDLRGTKFNMIGDKPAVPALLEGMKVRIGDMDYSIGIGGIHSNEAHRAVISDEDHALIDVDVASQYPNIIAKLGLYPKAIGPVFLDVYRDLIAERMTAQATGDKTKSDGIKISLNGVYGKLGSSYSLLYSPDLLIAVTLTGQLAVLMLIETAEVAGIAAVSANTDGVVFRCPHALNDVLGEIIASWESDTGFTVRRTLYRGLYSSSVNTYIAIGEDGKVKRKGAIADPWSENDLRGMMSKNPQMTVCSEAVVRYLVDGVPLDETIHRCSDPRMFVTVIKVNGGALWRGQRLGRVIRWYWSTDGEQVTYADGSRRVAKTEGARPMAELTGAVPLDLDRARYVEEARKIAADLGIQEFQQARLV